MDLLNFTQKQSNIVQQKTIIFENKHIKIVEEQTRYVITCFDEIGVKALHDNFLFSPAKSRICTSVQEVEEFYSQATADNQEGIMIKVLDKEYRAGKKVGYIYKIKPTSEDVDCVIVGAERGKGKRGGFFSSFYISIRVGDEFKTIGKVGSGITENVEDELSMQNLTKILTPHIIKEDEKEGVVYFKPSIIIQISYQELQESQTTQSKYALRFPKVVAIRNNDKTLEDITTLDEVLKNK